MASSLSSTLNRITPIESSNNLPKSHSFGRVYLSKGSKAELCRPLTCSVQSASSDTTTPLVKTCHRTDDDTSDTDNSISPALSSFWREVQGCNDWENLLDPLHPLIRQEIIRYGEFVTACYKAFDLDPASKRYLNCKYGKKRMFTEVGMGDCGYEVVKYIYATPEITIQNFPASCGRWIGFVAVSSDEATRRIGRRDIVITFRGTVTSQEWVANFMSSLIPAQLDPHNPRSDVKVESGFLSLYTSDEASTTKFGIVSCREQLLSEISRLLNKYKGENISLTMAGHSMGSALALLLAYDVAELELNRLGNTINGQKTEVPVTVFSFGGPRVGNLGFKNRCEELGVKVLRIANVNDPITKLPGVVFNNENFRVSGLGFSCYAHVGVELVLDFFSVQNPSCVHDLESYIGCLLKHSNVNSSNREEGFGGGFGFQIQVDEVMSNLMEKGRELLLSSHQNINVLPGLLSDAGNHYGVLGWNSRDLISSWGNELLFGLVLLLL